MNILKFKIPSFTQPHNQLLIDLYQNDTFESRYTLPPNSREFVFDECCPGELYHIEVIPSNYGSLYDMFYESPQQFSCQENQSNLTLKSFILNGNDYFFKLNPSTGKLESHVQSRSITNTIDFTLISDDMQAIAPQSAVVKNFTASIYGLSNQEENLIRTVDLKRDHLFTFDKMHGVRNYRIDLNLASFYSLSPMYSIFLSSKCPQFKKIKHVIQSSLIPKSRDIHFFFSYNTPPKKLKCLMYGDPERSNLISEEWHESVYNIIVNIPVNTYRFFKFELYDELGFCASQNYSNNFFVLTRKSSP